MFERRTFKIIVSKTLSSYRFACRSQRLLCPAGAVELWRVKTVKTDRMRVGMGSSLQLKSLQTQIILLKCNKYKTTG